MATTPESEAYTRRPSGLGRAVQVLTGISLAAFVVLLIGSIADWSGFSDDPGDESTFGDITWTTFAATAILAFLVGIVTFVRARRTGNAADRRAAIPGLIWLPIAIVITAIVSAIEG